MPFISDKVYELVRGKETVTSALAASPREAVESIAEKLYKHDKREPPKVKLRDQNPTTADLDRVVECGKFASRPSDLFLQVVRSYNAC
jgi:hypothetical protein